MTAIVGGSGTAVGAGPASQSLPDAGFNGMLPGSTESRVLDAVVTCAGRWGIEKTTVDDLAREAGVSRATVYRLFPGGKPSMVQQATSREAVAMLLEVLAGIEEHDELEDALVEMIAGGTAAITQQPALAYMRANEPGTVRRYFSFERLERLLLLCADVVAPSLHRFLDAGAAREVVIWCARLVVSHYVHPDPARELSDPVVARQLVRAHVLTGLLLTGEPSGSSSIPSTIQEQRQ